MAKFKKGDRVVTKSGLSDYGVPQFTCGTVKEDDSEMPWVLWDVGRDNRKWSQIETDLAKVHKFKEGDKVRVRKWVKSPKHGWDNVTHDEIGTITQVEGESVHVKFPSHSSWHGINWELAKVKEKSATPTPTATPDYSKWVGKVVRVSDTDLSSAHKSTKERYRVLIAYNPTSGFPFETTLYADGQDTGSRARWEFAELDEAFNRELEDSKASSYLDQPLSHGLKFTHNGKEYGVLDYGILDFNGRWALFTETKSDGQSFIRPRSVYIDCPYALTVKDLLRFYDSTTFD